MQFKRQVLQVLMAEIPVLVTGLVLTRSENRPPMFLGRKREGRPCKGDPVLEDIGGVISFNSGSNDKRAVQAD